MSNPELSDLENAVMDILWHQPIYSAYCKSREQVVNELTEIDKMRNWAKNLSKSQGRYYYLKWLDYFEDQHLRVIAQFDEEERNEGKPDKKKEAEEAAEERMRDILPTVPKPYAIIIPNHHNTNDNTIAKKSLWKTIKCRLWKAIGSTPGQGQE